MLAPDAAQGPGLCRRGLRVKRGNQIALPSFSRIRGLCRRRGKLSGEKELCFLGIKASGYTPTFSRSNAAGCPFGMLGGMCAAVSSHAGTTGRNFRPAGNHTRLTPLPVHGEGLRVGSLWAESVFSAYGQPALMPPNRANSPTMQAQPNNHTRFAIRATAPPAPSLRCIPNSGGGNRWYTTRRSGRPAPTGYRACQPR